MSKKNIVLAIAFTFIIIMAITAIAGCTSTATETTTETNTESASYTVTIAKLDSSIAYRNNVKQLNCCASVVSDDFVKVVQITPEQYAQLNVGDVVTVIVKDKTNMKGFVCIEEFNEEHEFFIALH